MGLIFRHPEPGEMVGDYRIVEKIGSGGFGAVFKAERAGLFFSVKFLWSGELGARARREFSILLRLENPGVVRFRACDRWLDPKRGSPYLVMDFVPGLMLEEFAKVKNPPARKSARIMLDAVLTLGEVHHEGVFHRDLKPENIIIRDEDERPVLIDFGVGSYVGAPLATPHGLPPGTPEYRSPEANLFNRANIRLAHYEFSATDELWALGVTFYWLLTNVLPFGDRSDARAGGLVERILHQTPVAPHLVNPRVPRALSDLCMKMLEKKPEARYASVVELCAALGGALSDAELDPSWELPLFEPGARVDEDEPPRGRAIPAPRARSPRHRTRLLAAAGLGVVLAAGVSLGVKLHDTSAEATTTHQAGAGREVASTAKPLDPPDGAGAEPTQGSSPAPVMITMPRKDDNAEKPQQKKQKVFRRVARAVGTGMVCKTLAGCPAPQQVRPTPEPAACPAGSVEAMADKLGVRVGQRASAYLNEEGAEEITVREGLTSIQLGIVEGRMTGDGGIFLSGSLIFGEERVYGRFTQARIRDGQPFPVCFEVWDIFKRGRGAFIREREGGPNTARIWSTVDVRAVDKFE